MPQKDIVHHPYFNQLEWPGGAALIDIARKGVEYSFLPLLNVYYGFSLEKWATILHVSDRTLFRYEKEKKYFSFIQAEKLLKLSLLLKIALRSVRDASSFRAWLLLPNTALGDVTPASLLDTFTGTEMVISVLIRAEYGILS
jgi:putative toxin-antitoxin system antitoxin component (TIGR02293 family)